MASMVGQATKSSININFATNRQLYPRFSATSFGGKFPCIKTFQRKASCHTSGVLVSHKMVSRLGHNNHTALQSCIADQTERG